MWRREAQPVFNLPARKNKKSIRESTVRLFPPLFSRSLSSCFLLGGFFFFHVKQVANSCCALSARARAPPRWDASVRRLICRVILSPPRLMSHCLTSPSTSLFSFIWLLTTPFLLLRLYSPSPSPLPSGLPAADVSSRAATHIFI